MKKRLSMNRLGSAMAPLWRVRQRRTCDCAAAASARRAPLVCACRRGLANRIQRWTGPTQNSHLGCASPLLLSVCLPRALQFTDKQLTHAVDTVNARAKMEGKKAIAPSLVRRILAFANETKWPTATDLIMKFQKERKVSCMGCSSRCQRRPRATRRLLEVVLR